MDLPERHAILIACIQKETAETSSRRIGYNKNAYVY